MKYWNCLVLEIPAGEVAFYVYPRGNEASVLSGGINALFLKFDRSFSVSFGYDIIVDNESWECPILNAQVKAVVQDNNGIDEDSECVTVHLSDFSFHYSEFPTFNNLFVDCFALDYHNDLAKDEYLMLLDTLTGSEIVSMEAQVSTNCPDFRFDVTVLYKGGFVDLTLMFSRAATFAENPNPDMKYGTPDTAALDLLNQCDDDIIRQKLFISLHEEKEDEIENAGRSRTRVIDEGEEEEGRRNLRFRGRDEYSAFSDDLKEDICTDDLMESIPSDVEKFFAMAESYYKSKDDPTATTLTTLAQIIEYYGDWAEKIVEKYYDDYYSNTGPVGCVCCAVPTFISLVIGGNIISEYEREDVSKFSGSDKSVRIWDVDALVDDNFNEWITTENIMTIWSTSDSADMGAHNTYKNEMAIMPVEIGHTVPYEDGETMFIFIEKNSGVHIAEEEDGDYALEDHFIMYSPRKANVRFDPDAPDTHFVLIRWADNRMWQASAWTNGLGSPFREFLPSAHDVIVADRHGNVIQPEGGSQWFHGILFGVLEGSDLDFSDLNNVQGTGFTVPSARATNSYSLNPNFAVQHTLTEFGNGFYAGLPFEALQLGGKNKKVFFTVFVNFIPLPPRTQIALPRLNFF